MKITASLCPQCYMEIPAQIIREEHGVWMVKQCPIHGQFTGLVERDPLWFDFCEKADAKSIYNGLLIDVTSKCNLKCKYCYHDQGNDRYLPQIINEVVNNKDAVPFILTGGEPTLHPKITEIIHEVSKHGETWMLTNGVKLCDEGFFDEVTNAGLIHDGFIYIGLSFHKESMGKDLLLLDLLRKKNLKLGTSFYVIDDLKQIDCALSIYRDNLDVMSEIRIKAASNLWNEDRATNKIYTSDMLKYLSSIGKTTIDTRYNNKISYANVIHEGLNLKLISWYDKWNIDLVDINCPPFYKSNDGNYYNLVTACMKNRANTLKIISSQLNESPMYQAINDSVIEYVKDSDEGLVIRRGIPSDIEQCADLWVDMAKEEDPTCTPQKEIWSEKMHEFIKHENNHLYIAKLDGKMVAFVSGYWDYDEMTGDRVITGLNFYVKPDLRKTEIGKKLHLTYQDVGKKLGVKKVIRKVTKKHSKILFNKGQDFSHYIIEERI
jgi:hypothetical protein